MLIISKSQINRSRLLFWGHDYSQSLCIFGCIFCIDRVDPGRTANNNINEKHLFCAQKKYLQLYINIISFLHAVNESTDISIKVAQDSRAKVLTWKRVVAARRVTLPSGPSYPAGQVTLLTQSSLCFQCKRFASGYKEMYEKLSRPGYVTRLNGRPFNPEQPFSTAINRALEKD